MAVTAEEPQFALDSLAVEDDQVVVRGRWHGVTGRRFVRPALRLDDRRRIVASLEHKPWAAAEGEPWVAAFPHDGDEFASAALEVAPDVTVALAGEPALAPAPPKKAAKKRPAKPRAEALREARDEARRERDDLRSRLEHVTREHAELIEERDAALQEAADAPARAREKNRAEVERLTSELDSRGRDHDDACQRATRAEAALEEATAEQQHQRDAAEAARREVETLRAELTQAKATPDLPPPPAPPAKDPELDRLRAELTAVQSRESDLRADLDRAKAPQKDPEVDALRAELDAAHAASEALRGKLHEAKRSGGEEADRLRAELEAERKRERPRPVPTPQARAAKPARVPRRQGIELPDDPARGRGARAAALALMVPLLIALLILLRAIV